MEWWRGTVPFGGNGSVSHLDAARLAPVQDGRERLCLDRRRRGTAFPPHPFLFGGGVGETAGVIAALHAPWRDGREEFYFERRGAPAFPRLLPGHGGPWLLEDRTALPAFDFGSPN